MEAVDAFTDFSTVLLPAGENELSRRCLRLVERWVPVGMGYFNEWPVRPNCGHFFGGVLWYCQDTCMPMIALALAASSREFDAKAAGRSADELRAVALQALRYACFTHDTGPEDCVRPAESWGRPEPAGTKWGERGRGFFPESQCGRTLAELAVTAALIRDLLGDEERRMLANIAADYLGRFGDMNPKNGVYHDTQMEENGWTSLGLAASLAMIPGHPRVPEWREQAKLWMFRAVTLPRDAHDQAAFADGRSVASLCGRTFTTLPDGTAENHGVVHPSYLASGLCLSGDAANVLRLYGQDIPPHLFWHRRDVYNTMKPWFDHTGSPHRVQGMDWPFLAYPSFARIHAYANTYLGDPDAALLERRTLAVIEQSSVAHGGRLIPKEQVDHCRGQQDPALMRERFICLIGDAYLAHRLAGAGPDPSEDAEFADRMHGVYVYPHAGALLHHHPRGVTSLAWRNRTMVLPVTREGTKLIGPAVGSMLASITVKDKAPNTRPVALKVREDDDRAAVLVVEDLAEGSVRRNVFFATLPNGKCLTFERLVALDDVTVPSVRQGGLRIVNDGTFGDGEERRPRRTLYWEGGERTFTGYAADSNADDVTVELDTPWINVDDRCGLMFRGTGRAFYRNQHWWKVWHAVSDELVLSESDGPASFTAGDQIAEFTALWCPEQPHDETRRESLCLHEAAAGGLEVEVDGILCVWDFDARTVALR